MIVIADLHIGKVADSFMVDGVPSQTRDILRRLSAVLVRAKMLKTSIVVAGDVFNRVNPTSQSISVFFSWLRDCVAAKVPVYIIAGNHDAGVDWSSATMLANASLPNVSVITTPSEVHVVDDHVSRPVLFFPHVPTAVQESAEQGHGSVSAWASSKAPKAEFVITHGMIDSSEYSNDIFFEAGNAMRIDPAAFPKLKLMCLGHIHTCMSGDKWTYPGSLTINNFGEVDERKGWIEVDLSDLSYTWYEYPDDCTPWVHVELDLTDKDETSLSEDAVRELVEGAIVKITVLAKSHGVVNETYIRQLFGKYGYVSRFETRVDATSLVRVPDENRVSHFDLLVDYISDMDVGDADKKLAQSIGREIIAKVMGEGVFRD